MTADAGPALIDLYEEFGDQVAFVTLYVREAHPGDRYAQPETMDDKVKFAREFQQRDQVPWFVAIDDIDGALHHQLDLKPNSAYLVAADGRVLERVLWSNDIGAIQDGLAAVAEGRRPTRPDRQGKAIPMLRGLGEMHRILGLSGRQARRDVLWQAPPLYVLSRLAHAFRPLPPLARSMAAGATLLAGAAVIGTLTWRWMRRPQ